MMPADDAQDLYEPPRNLPAKLRRRFVQWRTAKPLPADPRRALISFTFDDFPRSAAEYGADVLERFEARGCYYTCTGYLNQPGPAGPFFSESDIETLANAGHEIAAHTVSHMDCAAASTDTVLTDIAQNLDELGALGAPSPISQFAYPYGETQSALKNALQDRFSTCRGVLAGINRKGSDAMQLRAVELGMDEAAIKRAEAAIEAVARRPGWLVFFTHDVSAQPSPFGVSQEVLTRIVRRARDSGAHLATPSQAITEIEAVAA